MEILFGIFLISSYLGIFITMIVAAAAHNWFAFAGFLIAWILATIIGMVSAVNS